MLREEPDGTSSLPVSGIVSAVCFRGGLAGGITKDLLVAGALGCEPAEDGMVGFFASPKMAVMAAVKVVTTYVKAVSAGVATAELEGESGRFKLADEAQAVAGMSEPGQVLMNLATQELVRDKSPEDATFCDLGSRTLPRVGGAVRLFGLNLPGLAEARIERLSARPWLGYRFLGRREEIADVIAALGQYRLVSLIGPSGIGKSALAARVELEIQEQFQGGTYWIDLKFVSRSTQLVHRLAQGLDIHSRQEKTLLDQVAKKLEDREALLVFDGAEALRDEVREISEQILRKALGVCILVTGLRKLKSPAEKTILLGGLACSDEDDAANLESCDSVRLFCEEAASVVPYFSPSSVDLRAISHIAQLVDGSPWALKLCASWLGVLSARQILARLKDDPFTVLRAPQTKDGFGSGIDRAIGASLNELDRTSQILFRRLSIFHGPFDANAAEGVCAFDEALPRDSVLGALKQLQEVHLIQPASGLSTIRSFFLPAMARDLSQLLCREALETRTTRRHLDAYLVEQIIEAAAAISSGRAEALDRFDLLYEDVRAGWLREIRTARAFDVVQAVVNMGAYWLQRGYYAEAIDLISNLMQMKGIETSPTYRRLLVFSSWMAIRLAQYDRAEAFVRLAIRSALDENKQDDLARALNAAGALAFELLRPRTAARLLGRSLSLAREHLDKESAQAIQMGYAAALMQVGNAAESEYLLLELVSRRHGGWADLTLLCNLADHYLRTHNSCKCWDYLLGACRQYEATPDPHALASLYSTAAWAAFELENYIEAKSLLEAYNAIIDHYGLLLTPRKRTRKDLLTRALEGHREGYCYWDANEPIGMLRDAALRHKH